MEQFIKEPVVFPPPPATMPPPLTKPVIIPQRRRGDRLRGFHNMYSPVLELCDISEETWSLFLHRLNTSIGFDKKITLFNFTIDMATIATPSWELTLATLATQSLITTAGYIKSRAKSNAYLVHANEKLLMPRGLIASMVLVADLAKLMNIKEGDDRYDPRNANPTERPPAYVEGDTKYRHPYDTKNDPSDFDYGQGSSTSPWQQEQEQQVQLHQQQQQQLQLQQQGNKPTSYPVIYDGKSYDPNGNRFINFWFKASKKPIDFDPFDFGPGSLQLTPDQYAPLVLAKPVEPKGTMMEKALNGIEKYKAWEDRLPAKRAAKNSQKWQQRINEARLIGGQEAVKQLYEQEELKNQNPGVWKKFSDRNTVLLIVSSMSDKQRQDYLLYGVDGVAQG